MEAVMLYQDNTGRTAKDAIKLFADPTADVTTIETRLNAFRVVVASLCNPAIKMMEVAKFTPAGIITLGGNTAVNQAIPNVTDKALCSFGYISGDLQNKVLHLDIPAPDLTLWETSNHLGLVMMHDAFKALSDGLSTLTGLALHPIRSLIRTQARKAKG